VRHKNIPKCIDRNLKRDYQILTIFGTIISDTTGHLMTIYVSTSPNVCFCTTWENRTSKILHFYLMQYYYVIQITYI